MTASLNPESDISAFVNPVFDGALLTAREQNLMAGLVRNFANMTGLAPRRNSQYGGVTMNQISETDDLVSQAFTPATIANLTPVEFGAQYFVTDSRKESDPFSTIADASQDLGQAIASKVDTALIGLFNTFTGGTVGTAGSAITWGHVSAGIAQLRAKFAPLPYNLVLHPYQWAVLAKAASVASGAATNAATGLKDDVNSLYFVRREMGVNIFATANVTSGATCHAGLFSRDALALDMRRAPRIESERDTSRRGLELNLSSVFAYGLWRPTFGIDFVFDGSAPTS